MIYRPKHVDLIEIINKIIIVASSWLFIYIYIYILMGLRERERERDRQRERERVSVVKFLQSTN